MVTVGEIYQQIDAFAPFHTAMSFDNPGLLVGSPDSPVQTVLLSLDITPPVVQEAMELGAQLIVSHHPVIFHPLKQLSAKSAPYLLASYGISAVCAHTNLDMAQGGVNSCLAERLQLSQVAMLKEYENSGLPEALCGSLVRPYSPREFAQFVKTVLHCDGLRFTDGGQAVTRVGLCSGGGADLVYAAAQAGCQAFVTGESKHSILLDAEAMGITMVDAGHFYTEDVVILPLLNRLALQFPELRFLKSQRMHSPAKYL
ncbi:MAG: Nif3-like dinuclear metal center hexameric protein [Clostridiales bacterium]|jgi:dinuclear metal center YbgI/SA1388 family protein|nr:Nif3-like dinuclear metal center hexameric protein [Clostridiales bacterium]